MPDFRYFKLVNSSEGGSEAGHTIFPWLTRSDGVVIYDGSGEPKDGVETGASHKFDFNHHPGPESGKVVILGCGQKDASETESDTAHPWTYRYSSEDTVVGHYDGKGNFTVDPPNQSVDNAVALPDDYHSINSPAVAKLLVALGGVISPQMT